MTDDTKSFLALAVGDPAGIGPELAAKLIADPEVTAMADLLVIGDARVMCRAAEIAGTALDLPVISRAEDAARGRSQMLDLGHLDPDALPVGVASAEGGRFALENFRTALLLTQQGVTDAVCFTPFNKAAMKMAAGRYDDEMGFINSVLGIEPVASEFNVLENLWNARVTSHVPLSAVAELITRERVLRSIKLTHDTLRSSGFTRPRIAVAGLNPHAGDGGNFGHEDDREIRPAVEDAQAQQIDVEGPFSPDTVFVRATKGAYDAVLTMYHDQGQIAMKLIGFDRGVTLLGGYPFPICTPAHGSAYDIAGRGVANLGASRAAALLAARMASART